MYISPYSNGPPCSLDAYFVNLWPTFRRMSEAWDPPKSRNLIQQAVKKITSPKDCRLAQWSMHYCFTQSERIAHDLDHVRSTCRAEDRILEIGCIPPILTIALQELGHDVSGVDIMPARFAETIEREGLLIEQADIEQEPLPFRDNAFDVVIFNEVIEHLRLNPLFAVQEITRVLKPKGLLLLSTPNLNPRRFRPAPDLFHEYQKLETLGHMGHFRIFSPLEVVRFLERFGLATVSLMMRGKSSSRWTNVALRIFPSLRPRFSITAELRIGD